ncbi:MAG: PEP-CTERM sorting domain-containing protein [Proteobacteria bacterium]|nr:PEP-CTERM sorting domain-containing protein [Pseudomonadota bacterium]
MLLCFGLAAPPASALEIVFDTTYDVQGFFDATASGALEAAAAAFDPLVDSLRAISPGAGESWSFQVRHPGVGGNFIFESDREVPADTLVIFVGGRPLVGALGFASQPTVTEIVGDAAFEELVLARGQSGALLPDPLDFGPFGGSITFNSNVDWHFDPFTDPGPGQRDFLTTATHEIAHLLGFGNAPSWQRWIDGGVFTGAAASQVFGDDVPLDGFGAHWAEGVTSTVDGLPQETLMDPSTPIGTRQLMTRLDFAGLTDIGWQVVPEPATALLVGMGAGLLGWRRRHAAWKGPFRGRRSRESQDQDQRQRSTQSASERRAVSIYEDTSETRPAPQTASQTSAPAATPIHRLRVKPAFSCLPSSSRGSPPWRVRFTTGTSKSATCTARATNTASSRARLALSMGTSSAVSTTSSHGTRMPPQLIHRNWRVSFSSNEKLNMKKYRTGFFSTGDTEPESRAPAKCPHSCSVLETMTPAITALAIATAYASPQPLATAHASAAPHSVRAPMTNTK